MAAETSEQVVIHRAKWILPIGDPLIENGAFIASGLRVMDMGPFPWCRRFQESSWKVVDHGESAILPPLANLHTHLELSRLRGRFPLDGSGFARWVQKLMEMRSDLEPDEVYRARRHSEKEAWCTGTLIVGDITNDPGVGTASREMPKVHSFFELLGFDIGNLEEAAPQWELSRKDRYHPFSLAAHALYSTSPELVQAAKAWCRKRSRPFSIHLAEHREEVQFLRDGTGFCRELLERLGRWVSSWSPPKCTPVAFADALGILDSKTLLVHMVHVEDQDWEIVQRSGSTVCFCPRSNFHLESSIPSMGKPISMGIRCTLGTDSLATNTDLNLFREAAFVLDHHLGPSPAQLLAMMTRNGFSILETPRQRGSIDSGKLGPWLAVPLPESGLRKNELEEWVIRCGARGRCRWIE